MRFRLLLHLRGKVHSHGVEFLGRDRETVAWLHDRKCPAPVPPTQERSGRRTAAPRYPLAAGTAYVLRSPRAHGAHLSGP